VFLKWENPNEIPAKELALQWGVSPQVVYSLIGVAKRSPSIYEILIDRFEYIDKEIPKWIKRPKTKVDMFSKGADVGSVQGGERSGKDGDSSGEPGGVIHAAPPPQSRESISSIERSLPLTHDPLPQPNAASTSQSQPARPKTQPGVAESSDTASNSSGEDGFLGSLANEVVVKELTIRAHTILKKIALNPTMYLCYNYLSQVKDPETDLPYFEGDFANFLNFCVQFTMDKGLGIMPAMITGRPSVLQLMREQKRSKEEPNYIPLWRYKHDRKEMEKENK
jgi:hypothetical protein